jgi:hypothetical protein
MSQLKRILKEKIAAKSKEDEGEYGFEGDMAMSQLRSIIRNAEEILEKLEPTTDLPEWVQSKITLAEDYISTAANYLHSELEESVRFSEEKEKSDTQNSRVKKVLAKYKGMKNKFNSKPSLEAKGSPSPAVHADGESDEQKPS